MPQRRMQPLVLCYHSVSDGWSNALAVRPAAIERQLGYVIRRHRRLGVGDILAGAQRGFHVTFDDAYRAVLNVVPVLERMGVFPTIFVVTGLAEHGLPLTVRELVGEDPRDLATMNWDQIADLAERGFEIGSHTVTHPHLTALSQAEIERELAESRERIEDELARPCRLLAYPYGEHDERVRGAARRQGYEAAYGLWAGTDSSDRFALPRVDLYRGDSLLRASLKTSFLKPHASALLGTLRRRGQPSTIG